MTPRHSSQNESQSGVELAFAICRRRTWLALVTFVIVAAAAFSLVLWLPDLYRATATVLIERQQVSEAFVRPSVTAELETRIQTIRQDIMSRTRLTGLITTFDLYPDLREEAPLDVVVERMRTDIALDLKSAEQLNGRTATIAFTVSYTGRDPETVARIANTLASMYVEENTKVRGRQATRTAEFLRAQLESVRQELDEQEERANEFKLKHMGELPQQMEANLSSLERLNTQLRLNGENQIRAMDRRERLERELAQRGSAPAAASAPTHASEVAALRRELSDLRRSFTEDYPDVIRVRTRLAALEREAAEAPREEAGAETDDTRERVRRALNDVDAELSALRNEERALRQSITGYEQRVENAPKRQQEFLDLSRGSQATSERYDSLLKRYEEAQLAENLEHGANVEQFRILDSALPPRDVAAPNRLRLLIVGLLLSLGAAIGAMLIAERLDTTFHNIDDLRRFANIPVLVSIPRIHSRRQRRRRHARFALAAVSVGVSLVVFVAALRVLVHDNETIVRLLLRS
jgi:polysaccharide chain length determinant protein (PEP-CTERM system associated)